MENSINGTNPGRKTSARKAGVNIFIVFTYLLALAIGIAGGILVAQLKPEWLGLSQGAAAAQAQINDTIAKVGKLITLPTDEKPTVATVTDASKVKDQQFFQNAQNADVVLIYTKAQKAILYSPTENKIIEVGAVNINNQATQTITPTYPSPSPTTKE